MTLGLVLALESENSSGLGVVVHLLGAHYVVVGGKQRHLTDGYARLLAYLAFSRGGHDRRFVAGNLWPDAYPERAFGNLRAVLWRLRRDGFELVNSDGHLLSLHEGISVDVQLLDDWATRLIAGQARANDLALVPKNIDTAEILPELSDEWITMERHRLQQRMFHAMECMSRELRLRGRFAEAQDAALAVCRADSLRESAQVMLFEAYMGEGNPRLAQRRFQDYRQLVLNELGVEPSPELTSRLAFYARNGNV